MTNNYKPSHSLIVSRVEIKNVCYVRVAVFFCHGL